MNPKFVRLLAAAPWLHSASPTSRSWTSTEGEKHEEKEWFNVIAWGSLAEVCRDRLAKGQQVYIEGRLQTRGWEDSLGRRHFRTEVVAQDLIVLTE
jgi:single-strand DNA-binding protein